MARGELRARVEHVLSRRGVPPAEPRRLRVRFNAPEKARPARAPTAPAS